ncbi:class I adenylate-forming enzyme family protein [Pyxidicoccus sp. MSG2]|uniref:class I adenylate-forming enzyme family protein n=1 Tax=Pyxidicoccus sp. MSG2 TaxID=2996790 RepID=UPI0022709B4D|nr:fatty acid--CoA ligase family protein [Pyxidicoccus sp. MSG2]MCY1014854.1 fatty acid--CoA ligase family protein [Pyxidicoccus sp. MSG2]
MLTDGLLTLPYAALDAHLASLESFFTSRGVSPGAVVALECANTVTGALSLLSLLSRGYSVVLLPHPGAASPRPEVPRVCRHRVTVRSQLASGTDVSLEHPESFLTVEEVPGHHVPGGAEAWATGHLLLRTSGSIGTPKLALYTHERLLANALAALPRLRLTGEDRVLLPVPLAHMFGLGAGFLPGFTVGASLDFVEGANLLRCLEHERTFRPSVAFMTPALCTMMLRGRSVPEHYRHVVVAGDKLKPESFPSVEARFRRVVNLYGTTEQGVIAAADAEVADGPRATTVGAPLEGVALRLEPPESAGELPGDAGSLLCRHPHGFEGYVAGDGGPWTGEPPLRDGWYRTRDLGRLHPGGLLEVLGREDHSVNRDGRLVLLADIERAMETLPDVERAVTVLGGEHLRGRHILAFCTPREGRGLDGAAVRAACASVLPPYALPDEVRVLPTLPQLPNGKVDRRALTALATVAETPNASDDKECQP